MKSYQIPNPLPEMHPEDLVVFVSKTGKYWSREREKWVTDKSLVKPTRWTSATLSICAAPGHWEVVKLADNREEYLAVLRKVREKYGSGY